MIAEPAENSRLGLQAQLGRLDTMSRVLRSQRQDIGLRLQRLQREREAVLRELKRLEAELRLKRAILEGRRDYPGKQADIELCARKRKELGDQRLRQVIAAVGGGGCD